jgi:hypothetical protein
MNKYRGLLVNLLAFLVLALPSFAAVVTSATVPATRNTGDTITATIWNNDALGLYTYINNNIVPVLNALTTKGDLYVYNGSSLVRQGVGSNNQVLTADSAQANGIKWAALANTTELTTKGDILSYSSTAGRLPVGTNGQVLIADSTQTFGIKWGTPATNIPKGTIVAWSPAGAGTSTIPSGWGLCDGGTYSGVVTPNLIGKFIIGTRPSGSTSTAASGGYGVSSVDFAGAGTTTHTHTAALGGTTGSPNSTTEVQSGTGATIASSSHTHNINASGTSSAASTEPSDYALVYIEKL